MFKVKQTKSGPQVELWMTTKDKLRDAANIARELERYPEQFPDAQQLRDLLSKVVSPEPETVGKAGK